MWHIVELLRLPVNPDMVLIVVFHSKFNGLLSMVLGYFTGWCPIRILCFRRNHTVYIRKELYVDVDDLHSIFLYKNEIQIERNWEHDTFMAKEFSFFVSWTVFIALIQCLHISTGWHRWYQRWDLFSWSRVSPVCSFLFASQSAYFVVVQDFITR